MYLWSLPSSRGTLSGGRLAFLGRQALHSIIRGAACGGAGVGLAMDNGGPEVLTQLDARTSLTQRPVLRGPRLHGVASGVDFDLDMLPEGPVIIGRALFPEGVGAVVSREHIRITGSGSSWRAWDVSSFGTQLEASGATRRLPTSEAEAVQIYDGDKLVITADVFLVAAGLGPRPPPPPPFAPSDPPKPAVPHEDTKYITAVRDSIAVALAAAEAADDPELVHKAVGSLVGSLRTAEGVWHAAAQRSGRRIACLDRRFARADRSARQTHSRQDKRRRG